MSTFRGGLQAYESNGRLKWKFNRVDTLWSSPVMGSDGTLYVASLDSLYAITNSGNLKWSVNAGTRVAPAISNDGTIYIIREKAYLSAVNPDGSLKWVKQKPYEGTPVIGDQGTIYAGTYYENGTDSLFAISPDGSLKWTFTRGEPSSTFSLGKDGSLYMITGILTIKLNKISSEGKPDKYKLYKPYPSPFNPQTTVKYQLPKASDVSVNVYNILGRQVRTLVDDKQGKGTYKVYFKGGNLPSGHYIIRMQAGEYVQEQTVILLK